MSKVYDFGGYVTRNDLKCSDGRTIRKNAFSECDGLVVPLVWNHVHDDPGNVLGHTLLENRPDGVYGYGSFNDTPAGKNAKEMVLHGDVDALSIYANQLQQSGGDVLHGMIKEVSLVLAGANPGAYIDTLTISHSDGTETELEDQAVIFIDGERCELNHSDETKSSNEKDNNENKQESKMAEKKEEKTIKEIFDAFTDEQKDAVYAIVGAAVNDAVKNVNDEDEKEDTTVKHNVFENDEKNDVTVLSHSDMQAIINDAKKCGSLKESVLAHTDDYGIENIEYLFPDAKMVTDRPQYIKRDTDWVAKVMGQVHRSPFSRIKSVLADITGNDARALGFVKGNEKTDEVFSLLKRSTEPHTIYKKQKLNRDDVADITDFDVVSWVRSEMRMQLEEEIARAILIGDGRLSSSDDKIDEAHIRPIWTDTTDDVYAVSEVFEYAADDTDAEKATAFIDKCIASRKDYKGSGYPTLFCSEETLTSCLLLKDLNGRYIYENTDRLATTLRVKEIVTVPAMSNASHSVSGDTYYLMGLIVNLSDYYVGADKGGQINMFDDFDIDFNAQKYLIETRCSGALVKPKSALVIECTAAAEE